MHKLASRHFLLLAILVLTPWASAAEWSARLAVAEACCCNPMCPCLLNSPPTKSNCHATGLIEIRQGHYNDVRLDGLSLVVTAEMGKWGRFYVTDRATSQQAEAAVALVNQVPELAVEKVVSIQRVALSVSRSKNRIRFSTPVSVVEIEPLKDGSGKAVTVQHLSGFASPLVPGVRIEAGKVIPRSSLSDYVQYRTLQHRYHAKDLDFDYAKTHGATYTLKVSGRDGKPRGSPAGTTALNPRLHPRSEPME